MDRNHLILKALPAGRPGQGGGASDRAPQRRRTRNPQRTRTWDWAIGLSEYWSAAVSAGDGVG